MDNFFVGHSENLDIIPWSRYKIQPQPGATADDVLTILAFLDLDISQEVYESLPEATRRHFTAKPQ